MVKVGLESTPQGRRIVVSRRVNVPADDVWELFSETSHWPRWGPPVTAVEPADESIEAGMRGRIQALGVLWFPFRIERCANKHWTWSIWGFAPPADGHRVESTGPHSCRVGLELPLYAPWYVPLCLLALSNIASIALESRE
jgi:hypothetical protein